MEVILLCALLDVLEPRCRVKQRFLERVCDLVAEPEHCFLHFVSRVGQEVAQEGEDESKSGETSPGEGQVVEPELKAVVPYHLHPHHQQSDDPLPKADTCMSSTSPHIGNRTASYTRT